MRPEKITEELIESVCNYIAGGSSFASSAWRAGISESTFYRWIEKGKQPDAEEIYRIFYERVKKACEFSHEEALQLVRSAANIDRNWRAAAWFLERRFPDLYGQTRSDKPKQENTNQTSSQ